MTARQNGLNGRPVPEGKCSNPKCGRRLTDPKSILRSYGPVCWSRLQTAIEKEHQESKLPATINDRDKAAVSLLELRTWIEERLTRDRCYCGNLFKDCELETYDYGNVPGQGYALEGFRFKQWVYFHCSKCQNDTAIWKVVHIGVKNAFM